MRRRFAVRLSVTEPKNHDVECCQSLPKQSARPVFLLTCEHDTTLCFRQPRMSCNTRTTKININRTSAGSTHSVNSPEIEQRTRSRLETACICLTFARQNTKATRASFGRPQHEGDVAGAGKLGDPARVSLIRNMARLRRLLQLGLCHKYREVCAGGTPCAGEKQKCRHKEAENR